MVVPPHDRAEARSLLRRAMRQERQAVALKQKFARTIIDDRLFAVVANAGVIGLYAAMRGEPDPLALVPLAVKPASLPAIGNDESMVFRSWQQGEPLVPASWGGIQPAESASITQPDVVFVPLLAFDHALNRLGQGGGYYDRYFATHSAAFRIGLAWDVQRVAELDVEPWDAPLDAVITESTIFTKDSNRWPTR